MSDTNAAPNEDSGLGAEGYGVDSADDAEAHRIRVRAYHLWEASGRPESQELEFWERARELEGMSANPQAGLLPIDRPEPLDEAELEENLGEFPDRLSDQGERRTAPMTRAKATAAAR